jgi:hypothetical protein
MFETEIPERRAVKNRHHFIYMSGVYLALAILHVTLFFWHTNFNRGWNLAASFDLDSNLHQELQDND